MKMDSSGGAAAASWVFRGRPHDGRWEQFEDLRHERGGRINLQVLELAGEVVGVQASVADQPQRHMRRSGLHGGAVASRVHVALARPRLQGGRAGWGAPGRPGRLEERHR